MRRALGRFVESAPLVPQTGLVHSLFSGESHATLTDLDLIAIVECSASLKRALEADIDLVRRGVTAAGPKGKRLSADRFDNSCRCRWTALRGGGVAINGARVRIIWNECPEKRIRICRSK
jgi:hypothetical protein